MNLGGFLESERHAELALAQRLEVDRLTVHRGAPRRPGQAQVDGATRTAGPFKLKSQRLGSRFPGGHFKTLRNVQVAPQILGQVGAVGAQGNQRGAVGREPGQGQRLPVDQVALPRPKLAGVVGPRLLEVEAVEIDAHIPSTVLPVKDP